MPAITKYYRWGGLNNSDLFFHSSAGQKYKIEVLSKLRSFCLMDECLLSMSSMAFALCT